MPATGIRPRLLAAVLALPVPPLAAGEAGREHTVQPGQTPWSVAWTHGVEVEDLLRLNRLDDPTAVAPGSILILPEAVPQASPAARDGSNEGPRLRWPVRGRLTSPYGRRGRRLHAGIDIAAPPGTIIVAAESGRVVRAGKGWGRYGRVVLIDHGRGWSTLYAHASRVFVKPGQDIPQGHAVAAVGRSGNATGPHLHFEVWGGDRTLDPVAFLGEPAVPREAWARSRP